MRVCQGEGEPVPISRGDGNLRAVANDCAGTPGRGEPKPWPHSLTHDPIVVPVIHVGIGGMITVNGGDAMPARFRAGDPAVSIVVVQFKGIDCGTAGWSDCWGRGLGRARLDHQFGRCAA